MEYKGYIIAQSNNRGGKAGRGYNRTASIQIREWLSIDNKTGKKMYSVVKHFSFPVGDVLKCGEAIKKAKAWIDARE